MKIFQGLISNEFLSLINSEINKITYSESLWLFDSEHSAPHKLVKNELSQIDLFQDFINEAHIVIRCVKFEDKKICLYPHFDNYLKTFVIPILIPSSPPHGNLVYIENMRKFPKNIYMNIITKFIFQNPLAKKILLKYYRDHFLSTNIKPGDVVFFNGLTTLHFNDPVSTERRSILIHFENPYKHTYFSQFIEYFGKLRVKRI